MNRGPYFFLALLLVAGGPVFSADSLQKARFTEVIRDVRVTKANTTDMREAKVNDTFEVPEVIRTGMDSRAELEAPDKTIARIGANTIFSFEAAKRTMNLQSGSVLFHSPKGMGGGTIKTAAATAAVTGTTIMVGATSNGGFKLMVLEGSSKVTLPNGVSQRLNEGQLTFILPGTQTKLPVIEFRLSAQTKGSSLVGGFEKPLASLEKVEKAEAKQEQNISKGRLQNTTLRIAGDPKEGNIPVSNDGANFPSISEISPSSTPTFTNYLADRFSKINLSLLSAIPPTSEMYFNLKGESGIVGKTTLNINNSFAMFAANKITFSSGAVIDVPTSTPRGLSIQDFGFFTSGDLTFSGSATFKGASTQDLHLYTVDGKVIFNAGTIDFAQNKLDISSSQVMNISGVTFTGRTLILSGSTINLINTKFDVNRVDIYVDKPIWTVYSGTIPNTSNSQLNFEGDGSGIYIYNTAGNTISGTGGTGQIGSSPAYLHGR